MNTLLNDIKYAIRQLRKTPGFTAVAVVSLALGIGANTAIFSIINGLLFKPLPVHNPQELRVINWTGSKIQKLRGYSGTGNLLRSGQRRQTSFTYPLYRQLRDEAQGFSDVFAFFPSGVTAQVNSVATPSYILMVSGNFFSGYGVQPFLGRGFIADDERPQAEPVAVITYRFWQKHFGLDSRALGQVISLNQSNYTVVGVLPQRYAGPLPGNTEDIYIPLNTSCEFLRNSLTSPDDWWLRIMARLAPGANETQVQAACDLIFRQALTESKASIDHPTILIEAGSRGPLINRHRQAKPMWMLFAAVGLVLLIACTNLAGMLLARGASRHHEMAVRAAVGAGRWRLLRQSLTESLCLTAVAAALGIALSLWIKAAIAHTLITDFGEQYFDLRLDQRVLLFTIGISMATALLFGLLPAWRISRVDPASGLQSARLQGSPSSRLGEILVAAQVGLALLLVVVAGLLVQTLKNLGDTDPGFDPERLLVFDIDAGQAGYQASQRITLYEDLRRTLAALPGVSNATFSDGSLLSGFYGALSFEIPDRFRQPEDHWHSKCLAVGLGYLDTMRIPLLEGRPFNESDTQSSAAVMIVNQRFSRKFFPGESALGRSIKTNAKVFQIVGICADTKHESVRSAMAPIMYFANPQTAVSWASFAVRTVLPPLSLTVAVREVFKPLEAHIPIPTFTTQAALFDRSIAFERVSTALCVSLAALGLLLVCIGLYALISFGVSRRTGEIGLRMALGAGPGDIARPILRRAVLLSLTGIGVGIPVALAVTRILQSVVYGVEPHDPLTLIVGVGIILLVTLFATWMPVRRATRIDPMKALRYE